MSTFFEFYSEVSSSSLNNSVFFIYGETPYLQEQIAEKLCATQKEKGYKIIRYSAQKKTCKQVCIEFVSQTLFQEKRVFMIQDANAWTDSDIKDSLPHLQGDTQNILVINSDKKYTKASKLLKDLNSISAATYGIPKLYENQLTPYLKWILDKYKLQIDENAKQLLIFHSGKDFYQLDNDIQKLSINLQENQKIVKDDIEEFLGINATYNFFEWIDSLVKYQKQRSVEITKYLLDHSKLYPIEQWVGITNNFLNQLIQVHYSKGMSPSQISQKIGLHPFFVSAYINSTSFFSLRKLVVLIETVSKIDQQNKGIVSSDAPYTFEYFVYKAFE